jgi:hypothetical protein
VSGYGCEQCRQVAPELALRIASGEERAAALRHLATCRACRDDVRALTETADHLLRAAPELEPSAGFDQRVVDALTPTTSRRWSRRTVVAVCAAAAVVVLAIGATLGWVVARPSESERQLAAAVDDMNGRSLRVASLDGQGSEGFNRVVVSDGDPSWLLLLVNGTIPDGEYSIVCEYEGGWSISPGRVAVREGKGTWAATVARTLDDLTGVRLQAPDGHEVAGARFAS